MSALKAPDTHPGTRFPGNAPSAHLDVVVKAVAIRRVDLEPIPLQPTDEALLLHLLLHVLAPPRPSCEYEQWQSMMIRLDTESATDLVLAAQVPERVDDHAEDDVDQDRVDEDEKRRRVHDAQENVRPHVVPADPETPHVLQA
eukprot:3182646-Rhodomonas_salina.2